jgi:hypothetical protein
MTAAFRLHNRDAARAILDGISNAAFDAGIRSGRIPLPVNGLRSGFELDIARRRMVEERQQPPSQFVRPLSVSPLRIARTFRSQTRES